MKTHRAIARRLAAACALLALLGPATAGAQVRSDETPVEDVLEVLVVDRHLLAIDARGGGETSLRLELDEDVLWTGSDGVVGVVLTDRRVLAVAAISAAWQEARYRRTEQPAQSAQLGDRVALVITSERALGYNGKTGNLIEYRMGPQETYVDSRTGDNTAVVITDRNALGLSPDVGGFFPAPLRVRERIERVETRSNVATVTTDQRLLIFRSPTGTWEERRLDARKQ